jgi:CubicO group peptidase (beta-lactamase class C family)
MTRFDTTASRFLIAAIILFLFAQTMTPQTPAPDKSALARAEALRVVDAWLDSLQAYRHIPAISGGVIVGDNLVWSRGYGTLDADHKIPAGSDTIYSVCSISKLFTSISLMQQYEAGKVRLDDPITTYLPWAKLKDAGEDSLPITLRGILSHSAGLPRESDFPYWSGPDFPFPTRDQIRASIANQFPLSPSGRYFEYSNLGLTLVGETVEAVFGETYAQYAKTHVLDPIGLHDTRTSMPMDLYGTRLAVAYGALKRDGSRDLLKPFNAQGITPAAGYTSTVQDLAKFASWQFRLLRTGKPDVLKASTLREMQRVQFMDPNWKTTWGLGFSIQRNDNHTYVGHAGDCPGYHSVLMLRPEDELGVVLMDNAADRAAAFAPVVFAILDKRKATSSRGPLLPQEWILKPTLAITPVSHG